jgi:DNA helicase IV
MLDPNNQGAIHGSCDPEVVELVRGLGHPVKLKRNCRNTEEIVLQTQLMTGADIGEAEIDGRGTRVGVEEYKSDEEILTKAADRLKGWMEEEIRPENITVLTLNDIDRSIVRRFGKRLSGIINTIENGDINPRQHGKIAFSTVSKFKGLENQCVMLLDFECFDGSEEMVSRLYVGMTRAKAALWMGYPYDKAEMIEKIKENNVLKIFGGGDGKD